jgi:hypothetical protein
LQLFLPHFTKTIREPCYMVSSFNFQFIFMISVSLHISIFVIHRYR